VRTKTITDVDGSSSALEDTKGLDKGRGHAILGLVDLEVLKRTLSLSSPVLVSGDLDLAKGIALGTCLRHAGGGAVEVACELEAGLGKAKLLLRG
jgi:hypothetical protein